MHLGELKAKPVEELIGIAESMGIENIARAKKQEGIFNILKSNDDFVKYLMFYYFSIRKLKQHHN